MNVQEKLQHELDRMAMTPCRADDLRRLELSLGESRLRGEFTAIGPLACEFNLLALDTKRLAEADTDRLRQVSDRLSAQLSYLLEPIRLVETDGEQGVAQLRSDPPSQDEQRGRSYYELVARRGGSLRLSRFRKLPGQPRQAVPAQVTREVLLRLAADLISAVE